MKSMYVVNPSSVLKGAISMFYTQLTCNKKGTLWRHLMSLFALEGAFFLFNLKKES